MSERAKLLREYSIAQFAMLELHIYLDTHPSDLKAAALHNEFARKAANLKERYEEKFGPLTPSEGEGADWLQNPWPWDIERCD